MPALSADPRPKSIPYISAQFALDNGSGIAENGVINEGISPMKKTHYSICGEAVYTDGDWTIVHHADGTETQYLTAAIVTARARWGLDENAFPVAAATGCTAWGHFRPV